MFANKKGLKHRIQRAKSVTEIDKLLAEGETFKYATQGTKRKWERQAEKRKRDLENKKQ